MSTLKPSRPSFTPHWNDRKVIKPLESSHHADRFVITM
jgi:hypothetical protein